MKRIGCAGRCDRCSRLMVMVRLQDPFGETNPRVGWQCLICGKVVDLHSLAHRHELLEREVPRRCPPQEWRRRVVQYG